MSGLGTLIGKAGRSLHLQDYSKYFRTAEEQATKIMNGFKKTQTPIHYPYSELYNRFDKVVIAGVMKSSKNATLHDESAYKKAFDTLTSCIPERLLDDKNNYVENLEKHVGEIHKYTRKLQFGDSVSIDKSIENVIDNIKQKFPNLPFYNKH